MLGNGRAESGQARTVWSGSRRAQGSPTACPLRQNHSEPINASSRGPSTLPRVPAGGVRGRWDECVACFDAGFHRCEVEGFRRVVDLAARRSERRKSSAARAVQRAGGALDCWVLAGDQHLLRLVPADELVRYDDQPDSDGDWWTIPFVDGRVVGRPRAGPRAMRLLEGMYRAAISMTDAGNNVVLEDVVWEPKVATLARELLGAINPLIVRLVCPTSLAMDREQARQDRFVGAVAAYADEPDVRIDAHLTIDSSLHDRNSIAQQILAALVIKAPHRASETGN